MLIGGQTLIVREGQTLIALEGQTIQGTQKETQWILKRAERSFK